MVYKRSSLRIILHSVFGFLVLLVFLILMNTLALSINSLAFLTVVEFFNSLLGLFFILFLVGMINSLFWNFKFPLNLLAPVSGAVLGVFIVELIYRLLELSQTLFYFNAIARILSYKVYALVFFATLIIGYLVIFNEENQKGEGLPKEEKTRERMTKKEIAHKKRHSESDLTWEDVGHEFKKVFHNIGKALNSIFEPEKKKRKRK